MWHTILSSAYFRDIEANPLKLKYPRCGAVKKRAVRSGENRGGGYFVDENTLRRYFIDIESPRYKYPFSLNTCIERPTEERIRGGKGREERELRSECALEEQRRDGDRILYFVQDPRIKGKCC